MYPTDPLVADTDGDGLSDGYEVNTSGTDPLDTDTDDDNANDYVEITGYGTDPLNPDTDGDGLLDGDEVMLPLLTDPLDADSDDDGLSDGFEAGTGTDPLDSNDPGSPPVDVPALPPFGLALLALVLGASLSARQLLKRRNQG